MPSTEQDPLKWMLSGGDALFENSIGDAKTGRVFHFRWKDAPYGLPMKLLCVPITGTESIPDGKARKEYAKNHRMESCYFATAMFGPSLAVHAIANNSEVGSQQEQDARIQKGEASIVIVGTRPTGAKIWIDGNEAGITPMAFVLLRHRDTPRSILVTLDGYKTVEKRVVPDGKTIPIGVTLEPN
jgi:hypothetical protein